MKQSTNAALLLVDIAGSSVQRCQLSDQYARVTENYRTHYFKFVIKRATSIIISAANN